ncbi:MAG: hypothetical protein OEV06_10210, partial [Anaerolineae bacterium]|nr:hypothetical protein [Anaerolineae bacterium]
MNLRSAAVLLSLAIVVSLPNTSAAAQDGFAISEQQVSYLFGQHIAFQAQLAASTEVAAVEIVFREQQGADTIVLPADLQDDGQVLALYDFSSG